MTTNALLKLSYEDRIAALAALSLSDLERLRRRLAAALARSLPDCDPDAEELYENVCFYVQQKSAQ